MSQLDDAIEALRVKVEENTTEAGSAIAYIKGVPDLVAAAVAEALAAGATPEQLTALTNLQTKIGDETQAFIDAVPVNTPAALKRR